MTRPSFGIFADAPWNLETCTPPDEALQVPTMLSDEEARLLFWLGANWATGEGAVCDLGCFAGGSTARLAAGLSQASVPSPIHAFDFFTITPEHKEKFLYNNGVRRFWGQDLLPCARRLLRPWRDRVTFHKTDIVTAEWPGGKIEVLFVDVMKSPVAADAILDEFYPHLIPGHSVIVHQDYQHWRQPWIAAQMELLRPGLRPIAWAEKGTVVFGVDAVPDAGQRAKARVANMTDQRLIDLLKSAVSRAATTGARHQLARAILGLRDCPGCRVPFQFDPGPINWKRVRGVLDECGVAVGPVSPSR
ncbi:MAG: class I SAM-dependent methyltransferase [Pseudomonadota bacterium]